MVSQYSIYLTSSSTYLNRLNKFTENYYLNIHLVYLLGQLKILDKHNLNPLKISVILLNYIRDDHIS